MEASIWMLTSDLPKLMDAEVAVSEHVLGPFFSVSDAAVGVS